jgi:hypothetical protein
VPVHRSPRGLLAQGSGARALAFLARQPFVSGGVEVRRAVGVVDPAHEDNAALGSVTCCSKRAMSAKAERGSRA